VQECGGDAVDPFVTPKFSSSSAAGGKYDERMAAQLCARYGFRSQGGGSVPRLED
jgi:hypothetical protein